jgi:hypothetical protein
MTQLPHGEGLSLRGLLQVETAAMALWAAKDDTGYGRHMLDFARQLRTYEINPYQGIYVNIPGQEGEVLRSRVIEGLRRLAVGDGPPYTATAAHGLLAVLLGEASSPPC